MDWIDYSKIITSFLAGILGIIGYLNLVRDEETDNLTTLGKIAFILVVVNTGYLLIVQFFDLKTSNTKYKATIDSLSLIIDKSNTTISRLEHVGQDLTTVKVDLQTANDLVVENLLSQKTLLSNTDRILNPIKSIDFALTLEYSFDTDFRVTSDSILHYRDVTNELEAKWDSITTNPSIATFEVDSWEKFDENAIIFYEDSLYNYKGAHFKFENGKLLMVTLTPKSHLFQEMGLTDYLMDQVNQYVVFSENNEYDDSYYHLILLNRKKKLPENIIQNRYYLNTSTECDIWLKFDFEKQKLVKKIWQPYVYQYWQGKNIKSVKDFAGFQVKIKDATDRLQGEGYAGLSGFFHWPPLPDMLNEMKIIFNNSIILSYSDKEMPTGNNGFTKVGLIEPSTLE